MKAVERHLYSRNGYLYYRSAIPRKYQAILSIKETVIALHSKDRREARVNPEFQQDLRDWTDKKSSAEKLTRLKTTEMAAQVKDDPRLIGTQTWSQVTHSLPRPDVI